MASALARLPALVRTAGADIKLAHSVFALPFALLGAGMAGLPYGLESVDRGLAAQLALVVACMFFGRCAAMLANRLIDRKLDAENPRTRLRALPSGAMSPREAIALLGASCAAFMLAASGFGWLWGNWWPAALALPVLAWICSYGWCKRVSAFCHAWLGSSLAISPLAAALAIQPGSLAEMPALWLLSVMVLGWVLGFDVIYALQDVAVDRRDGLHSLPARRGERTALLMARAAHACAVAALSGAAIIDDRFGVLFRAAVALVLVLLVVEHATVHRWGTQRIALAFFTLNGVIACILGAAGLLDLLL